MHCRNVTGTVTKQLDSVNVITIRDLTDSFAQAVMPPFFDLDVGESTSWTLALASSLIPNW